MGYSNEKLGAIAAKLKTMPAIEKKKQEHSKQDAVKLLAKEIAALQKAWLYAGSNSGNIKGRRSGYHHPYP
jgi:hypothetical protein